MKKITLLVALFLSFSMGFAQTETYLSETGGENNPIVYIEGNYQYDPCIFNGPGNTYENGKSCTQNLGRIVANDLVVLQTENMFLSSIRASIFMGATGSGVNAAFVDYYIYEDAAGQPGDFIGGEFSAVPTSQIVTGTNFGFDVWDIEIAVPDIILPGGGGSPITYWIGLSVEATDGSNVFWENSTAGLIGFGEYYDDGTGGTFVDPNLEGVYTFTGDCRLLGLGDNSANTVNIYPNPATNGIVNIETTQPGEKQVVVFDILGKKVIDVVIANTVLNVSTLNGGIYMIQVTQNNATTVTKLIIK